MQRKTEIWIIGIFVLVIAVVTVIAIFYSSSTSAPIPFTATTVPALTSADWTRGDATSTVSVIEYGDFECPACGAYEPIVEQLTSEYGNRVLFAFRNFPLYQIHPFAMIAAQAAEAAGLQGKYWEMHDLLYQKQAEWTANTSLSTSDVISKYFNVYATTLGLNVTKFDTDINSGVVTAKVQKDLASGNAAQVDHTPTFFVNLTQIANPQSAAAFQNVIEAALASSTVSTGSPQAAQ